MKVKDILNKIWEVIEIIYTPRKGECSCDKHRDKHYHDRCHNDSECERSKEKSKKL